MFLGYHMFRISHRVAILMRSSDHYSVNSPYKLLGAQAQRQAQLQQLGFSTVEVRQLTL